jgi:hypothetical protein
MTEATVHLTATIHQTYAVLVWIAGRSSGSATLEPRSHRDRGAVSLEQVLWFVAAGVSVAVIAAILWSQIRDRAETEPVVPAAP